MAEEKNQSTKILDLDSFVPEDREVVIAKKSYTVRGDASVKMMLKLMKNADVWQKKPDSDEAIEALLESIQGYFKTPIDRETLIGIGFKQLPRLITFLYSRDIKKEGEEGEEKNDKGQLQKK